MSSTFNKFVDAGYECEGVTRDAGPGAIRVLLADDDPEMRELLCDTLSADGFDIIMARDGFELLEVLRAALAGGVERAPQVVVADIRMPGLNGLDAVRFLRQSDSSIPVILITAFGDDATRERAQRLGAEVLLQKPVDLRTLREAVLSLAGS